MSINPQMSVKKQRLSNYELLRIFSILLISLMHGIRDAYGSPEVINSVAHVSVNAIGNMGVTLFVLISGFFGIRFRNSKLFWLWSTMLFYSLLIFAIQYYLQEIPQIGNGQIKEFIKQLYTACTPLTSGTWWFCTSYAIVLLLSPPLLNKASENMTKRQFQYLLAVLITLYSLSPTFLMHSLSNTPNGKCTENMILAYFLGRYLSIFGIPNAIKMNTGKMLIFCLCLIFIVNYWIFDPLFLSKDHSLFIILAAVCVFHYFGKINIQSEKASNAIRYVASYTFPFYLLNIFLWNHLDFQFAGLADSPQFLMKYLLVQFEIIVITVIAEFMRRLIMQRTVQIISNFIDERPLYKD